MVYFFLGKVLNSLFHNLSAFGQIFIAGNGQILKTQYGDLVTLNVPSNNVNIIKWDGGFLRLKI